jgi:5-methyltetrahydropteroyltriglutamate--homocysteine methyltransferase
MDFVLANHSSYPGGGEGAGRPDPPLIAAVVAEQVGAGLDVVTDGQIGWDDPISHVMGQFDGVRVGPAAVFPGTCAPYRQPLIHGVVRRVRPVVAEAFVVAQRASPKPVKPVLPGPYTLAQFSRIEAGPYQTHAALAQALAELLAQEVTDLVARGAQVIQLDEPAVLQPGADFRLIRDVFDPIWAARGTAQLVVATYWGDAGPVYAQLDSIPADVLAIDVPSTPSLVDLVASAGAGKELALGIVDGRSNRLEPCENLARDIGRMLQRYIFDRVYLQPSCGLGTLSAAQARQKLQRLGEIAVLVR